MTDIALQSILHRLRRLAAPKGDGALTDAQLLRRFVETGDQAAFEVLVWRYVPLVLGCCRKLLGHAQDAEDAFQATFLTLTRKAGSIAKGASLAGWLTQVACRIALRLRTQTRRRQKQERHDIDLTATADRTKNAEDHELWGLLAEEMMRLPDRYRLPLVACYLEGKTQEQAARELSQARSSLSRDLARGCDLLRARLTRRGVSLSTAALITLLTERATAAVSAALVLPTVTAALEFVAGVAVSSPAAALAHGVIQSMFLSKMKAVAEVVLMLSVLAGGAAGVAHQVQTSPAPQTQSTEKIAEPPKAEDEKLARVDLNGDPLPEGVLARLGTDRLRHWAVSHLFFHPDGKTLISFSWDQTLRSWDLATGKLKQLQRLDLPRDWKMGGVLPAALAPGGKAAAQVSREHLHIWDVTTGKEIHRIPMGKPVGPEAIVCMEFSPDSKTLAMGNDASTILLWDVVAGKERARLTHNSRARVPCLAFTPDGKTLAAVVSNTITLWDLATSKSILTLPGGAHRITFSTDGKTLLASSQRSATLWDVATGVKEAHFPAQTWSYFTDIALAPDGKTLAQGTQDGIVLRDRATHKEIRKLTPLPTGWLSFSPDGKTLASWNDSSIRLWDVVTGKPLHTTQGHDTEVSAVAYSPDGKLVASATGGGKGDGTICLWEAATGKPLLRVPTGINEWVRQLVFSADGKKLVSCADSAIRIWDVPSGKERGTFLRAEDKERDLREDFAVVHVSPDGSRLSVLGSGWDEEGGKTEWVGTLWEIADGKRTVLRRWPGRDYGSLQFVQEGKQLALAKDQSIVVHDPAANGNQATMTGNLFFPTAFSADGKLAALSGLYTGGPFQPDVETEEAFRQRVAEAESVRLWDTASGRELLKLETGDAFCRAFSPDGRYLATTDQEDLRLWEAATGKEVLRQRSQGPFRGKMRLVGMSFANCLAFAPDGRSVATGHPDTSALVWDLALATRQKVSLDAKNLDRLWSDLAGDDAAKAYHAAGTLIAAPRQAVPLLHKHLQPVAVDDQHIARQIADLDSEQFMVREAARKSLQDLGDLAEPALRKALEGNRPLEVRKRIEALLPVPWVPKSAEVLRQVRAVHILEQIGSADAKAILQRLATGAAGARQTRDAQVALARLSR